MTRLRSNTRRVAPSARAPRRSRERAGHAQHAGIRISGGPDQHPFARHRRRDLGVRSALVHESGGDHGVRIGRRLYIQAEPEYRSLEVGTTSERGMIARHPLMSAAVPISEPIYGGISLSNLLDRSFQTSVRGTQVDRRLDARYHQRLPERRRDRRRARRRSRGSPGPGFDSASAAHAITGDNRLRNTQRFDDSARFAPLIDTSTVTYVGTAVSAGFELFAGTVAGLAGSYRKGGIDVGEARRRDARHCERSGSHVVQRCLPRHQGHDDRGAHVEGHMDADARARLGDAADLRWVGHERRRRRARTADRVALLPAARRRRGGARFPSALPRPKSGSGACRSGSERCSHATASGSTRRHPCVTRAGVEHASDRARRRGR